MLFRSTGAAGGAALVLRVLGARALPGPRLMARLVDLASAARRAELIITTAGEIYDVPTDGLTAAIEHKDTRPRGAGDRPPWPQRKEHDDGHHTSVHGAGSAKPSRCCACAIHVGFMSLRPATCFI